MEHNIIIDTACTYNTENTLNRDIYDFLHYTKGNYMGVWIPNKMRPDIIACDVYAKMGKLNVSFVKEVIRYHEGKHCYLTIKKENLRAKWLASNMEFAKISESNLYFCYYKKL